MRVCRYLPLPALLAIPLLGFTGCDSGTDPFGSGPEAVYHIGETQDGRWRITAEIHEYAAAPEVRAGGELLSPIDQHGTTRVFGETIEPVTPLVLDVSGERTFRDTLDLTASARASSPSPAR